LEQQAHMQQHQQSGHLQSLSSIRSVVPPPPYSVTMGASGSTQPVTQWTQLMPPPQQSS